MSSEPRVSIAAVVRLNERLIESQLWVLGVYEVVRTLDQRVNGVNGKGENKRFITSRLAKKITAVKRRIARLRMPLAKLERPAGQKHQQQDPARVAGFSFVNLWKDVKRVPP